MDVTPSVTSRRDLTRDGRRAFTLIETIVALVVLAMLAGIAVVSYLSFTRHAQDTRAKTHLTQLATGSLGGAMYAGSTNLMRVHFDGAITDFATVALPLDRSGQLAPAAAGSDWLVLGHDQSPADDHQFAVGFDSGPGSAVNSSGGARAAALTRSASGRYVAALVRYAGKESPAPTVGMVDEDVIDPTPQDVLDNPEIVEGGIGPNAPAVPVPTATPGMEIVTVSWPQVPGAVRYCTWFADEGVRPLLLGCGPDTSIVDLSGQGPRTYWVAAISEKNEQSPWSEPVTADPLRWAPTLTARTGADGESTVLTWESAPAHLKVPAWQVQERVPGESTWVDVAEGRVDVPDPAAPPAEHTLTVVGPIAQTEYRVVTPAGTRGSNVVLVKALVQWAPVLTAAPTGQETTLLSWPPAPEILNVTGWQLQHRAPGSSVWADVPDGRVMVDHEQDPADAPTSHDVLVDGPFTPTEYRVATISGKRPSNVVHVDPAPPWAPVLTATPGAGGTTVFDWTAAPAHLRVPEWQLQHRVPGASAWENVPNGRVVVPNPAVPPAGHSLTKVNGQPGDMEYRVVTVNEARPSNVVHVRIERPGSLEFPETMFGQAGVTLGNSVTVHGSTTTAVDAGVVTHGNLVCRNSPTVWGSVSTRGTASLADTCNVKGSAWALSGLTLDGTAAVGGDVHVAAGSATRGGGGVGGKVYASGGCGTFGAQCVVGPAQEPAAHAFPQLAWDARTRQIWTEAGYTVVESNDCAVVAGWLGGSKAIEGATARTIKTPTLVRTACKVTVRNHSNLALANDVAIFADGGFSFSQSTTFRSTNAAARRLHLVQPSSAKPVGCTETGILLENKTMVQAPVEAVLYTPCNIHSENQVTFFGMAYAGGTVTLENNQIYHMRLVPVWGAR